MSLRQELKSILGLWLLSHHVQLSNYRCLALRLNGSIIQRTADHHFTNEKDEGNTRLADLKVTAEKSIRNHECLFEKKRHSSLTSIKALREHVFPQNQAQWIL